MTNDQLYPHLVKWLRAQAEAHDALADAIEEALATHEPIGRRRMLVPLYSRDPAEWDRLLRAATKVDVLVVFPDSAVVGRTTPSTLFGPLVERCAATPGVTALGYVTNDVARRDPAAVDAEVELWYRLYPKIRGIFFDEQPSGAEHIDWCAARFAKVKAHGGLVASNPGTSCDEGYLSRAKADVLVLWENFASAGDPRIPAWAQAAPDAAVACLIHHATDAQLVALTAKALAAGFGDIFATSSGADGTWSTCGTGFDKLIAALAPA